MTVRRWIAAILVALLLGGPLAAWAFYKPVRLFAPELAGVTCDSAGFCVDDLERAAEAGALYDEARQFVEVRLGPLHSRRAIVFCATEACAHSFGLGRASANTVGLLGSVFGPRAWHPYYVRHELIHQLQHERLGSYRFVRAPKWFIEGMAYAMSDDPRAVLAEPCQQYRARFEAWRRGLGQRELWAEARRLPVE